jgi:hypothetical protein
MKLPQGFGHRMKKKQKIINRPFGMNLKFIKILRLDEKIIYSISS